MVVQAPSKFAVLPLATFLVASACVGGPSLPRALQVEPGQRTTVRLMQFTDGQVLSLQNESSGSAKEVYSDDKGDLRTKVVADAQLQALLDVFAEKGMFATATAQAAPDARDALVVQREDQRWVWSRRRLGLQEDELAFHEAKAYFLSLYNEATAYHSTDPKNRPDLRSEQDRARAEAEAAKRKLQDLQGRRQ